VCRGWGIVFGGRQVLTEEDVAFGNWKLFQAEQNFVCI
jgi:hypothetical protein